MMCIGYANYIILAVLVYAFLRVIVYLLHPPSSNKVNKRNNMNLYAMSIYA